MKNIFDMSSVIWTSLRAGKDVEGIEVEHEGKKKWINSAQHGYENAVNLMELSLRDTQTTPIDAILVFEGRDSKKRRAMIEPTYKGGSSSKKAPEEYVQFNLLKEMLIDTFLNLGACGLSQPFVEGDDVIGWLTDNLEEDAVITTNDGDMTVLNKVNEHGATIRVRLDKDFAGGKFAYLEDKRVVHLYKTLVGDTSDNIKGCPGFGIAAWENLLTRYDEDGCMELLDLIAQGKKNDVAQIAQDNNCKLLAKVVDQWDTVLKSYKLSKIHPEWVHTIRQQLEWTPGMVMRKTNDERLRKWRATNRLITADNYEEALAFLQQQLKSSGDIAFDIETSTPDESDDWLAAQGKPDGVDVFGSYLVGFSLTFGRNNQFTYYVSVKHADTNNITMVQAREMLEACKHKMKAIQNTSFELCVLYEAQDEDGTYWRDHWKDDGEFGFMPNIYDTLFEASYVDENVKLGLKERSLMHLRYEQQTFDETTKLEGKPFPGGQPIVGRDGVQRTQYKMHELPATHVFGYGADDTICTAALHNFYKLHMQLDHHWNVYKDVELDAAYMHAKNFCDGMTISVARSKELEHEDKVVHDNAWAILRKYLMENGWPGTVPPTYDASITAKEIKEAYGIVMGLDADDEPDEEDDTVEEGAETAPEVKDAFLSSRVRTPSKLVALLRAEGHEDFAAMLEGCLAGKGEEFTKYVRSYFKGEPKFKFSNKQMQKLLYEVMALPVRVRGKPTAKMKSEGKTQGNPKGDVLAVTYAKMDATPEQVEVLTALGKIQMVRTRMSLYYTKYPYFVHWKDGKIHGSHRQCGTNTRRASEAAPNKQQLPKNMKVEGEPPRYRQVVVPHRLNAVVVSMDFSGQELRVIADYSQDPNMLACYVGEEQNLRDMHILTGLGILNKKEPKLQWTYDYFKEAISNEHHLDYKKAKKYRALGKTVNFATEYGAQAAKLALTMLVSEDEAQTYIDIREETFARAAEWKLEVVDEAKTYGWVTTMLGARRHLTSLLMSEDRFTASKAERQAVNFKIQSSSAEMTKKAEGRMWRAGLFSKFDAVCYGPIHDEVVASVLIEDLPEFLKLMHGCMVQPYAKMRVPILSSISFGKSFGEQIEVGNYPTQEAVEFGLTEMAKAEAEAA